MTRIKVVLRYPVSDITAVAIFLLTLYFSAISELYNYA